MSRDHKFKKKKIDKSKMELFKLMLSIREMPMRFYGHEL